MKTHLISVPQPCHEDWNAMTPNEQGRYCLQCAKTVTDFTGMNALEIQSYLLENNGKKVCGRFKASQLDKVTVNIPRRVLFTQTKFKNVFLLALLVSMGTTLFSCNDGQKIGEINITKIDTVAITHDSVKPEPSEPPKTVNDSDATEISFKPLSVTGVVISEPLPSTKNDGVKMGKVDIRDQDRIPLKKIYVEGEVAIDPIPQPTEDFPIMGDTIISDEHNTILPPPKVENIKSRKAEPEK